MAIAFIDKATVAGNSVALPSHVAGDIIVIYAYRSSSALAITKPADYTNILNGVANTNADCLAYKFAASSSETSGTWANAEGLIAEVYRGVSGIGASLAYTNVTTPFAYPALTLNVTVGTSWVAAFAGIRIATQAPETGPSGMTNRSSQIITSGELASHDTDGGVSSWAGGNGGATGGNRHRINTVELLAAASGSSYTITASAGTFGLAGSAASLRASRKLPAATGSYSLSGAAAALRTARKLTATSGAFTLTGSPASLTYSPIVAGYTLSASSGVFAASGQAATLRVGRRLSAEPGSFTLSGLAADLRITGWTLRPSASGEWTAQNPPTGTWVADLTDIPSWTSGA